MNYKPYNYGAMNSNSNELVLIIMYRNTTLPFSIQVTYFNHKVQLQIIIIIIQSRTNFAGELSAQDEFICWYEFCYGVSLNAGN